MVRVATGRVFRIVGGDWIAIGDQLAAWHHAPPRPDDPIAVWVLPAGEGELDGYRPGDVITYAQTAHQLIAPVPRGDVAWDDVARSALTLHGPAEVAAWVEAVELWLCRRLPTADLPSVTSPG